MFTSKQLERLYTAYFHPPFARRVRRDIRAFLNVGSALLYNETLFSREDFRVQVYASDKFLKELWTKHIRLRSAIFCGNGERCRFLAPAVHTQAHCSPHGQRNRTSSRVPERIKRTLRNVHQLAGAGRYAF